MSLRSDDLDSVSELYTHDDFRQLVVTVETAPASLGGLREPPLRRISVSGSAKVPGWQSWKTLALVTAYHSFGGEVEASNTPTIRRLITIPHND